MTAFLLGKKKQPDAESFWRTSKQYRSEWVEAKIPEECAAISRDLFDEKHFFMRKLWGTQKLHTFFMYGLENRKLTQEFWEFWKKSNQDGGDASKVEGWIEIHHF